MLQACPACHADATLALIDPATGAVTELSTPFTSFAGPSLAVHEVRAGAGGQGAAVRAARVESRQRCSGLCRRRQCMLCKATGGNRSVAFVQPAALSAFIVRHSRLSQQTASRPLPPCPAPARCALVCKALSAVLHHGPV